MPNARTLEMQRATARSAVPAVAKSQPVAGRLRTARGLRHLLEAAAETPSGLVFVQNDGSDRVVSYADVLARAKLRLHELRPNGLGAGDRAVLLVGDNEQFVLSFWACVLGGVVAAPLVCPASFTVPSDPLRKLQAVWGHLGRPVIMGDASLAVATRSLG